MKIKNKKLFAFLALVLTIIVVLLFILTTKTSAAVSDTRVKISGFWYSKEISYSEIETVNIYTGEFEYGERTSGINFIRTTRGDYENELLGKYQCASNKNVDSNIIVKLKNGKYFVFNSVDASHTLEIYNFIKPKTIE